MRALHTIRDIWLIKTNGKTTTNVEVMILLRVVRARRFIFILFKKGNNMAKNFLIALLLIAALGCKKNKFSDDDTNLYKWKRDLYRAPVIKEEPALFYSRDGKIGENRMAILVSSDHVILTEYRKDKQQDSIYKASGKMQVYKYEKLERVGD